jgi:hypothetical protein
MFDAHFNLGRYYQQKSDIKNAGFHLNRALRLAVDNSQKEMASQQLQTLKPIRRGEKGPGKE